MRFCFIIFCGMAAALSMLAAPVPQTETNAHLLALSGNLTPAARLKHLQALLQVAEDPITHESRPFWSHRTVRDELEKIRTTTPASAEAKTARLWLAVMQQYAAQTNTGASASKSAHQPVIQQLKELRASTRESWHSSAVDLVIGYAELAGGNSSAARTEFTNLLRRIPQIVKEKDPGLIEFLKAADLRLQDAEPEARLGLAMAFSFEGKNAEAIQQLRELKTRFPVWSRKNSVEWKIESLQKNSLPWSLPAYAR